MAKASEPEKIQHLVEQALAAHRSGNFDAACEAYGGVVLTQPNLPDIWRLYGMALAASGNVAAADDALIRALVFNPAERSCLGFLGAVRLDLNDPASGLAALRRAMSLGGADDGTFNNLGNALRRTGALHPALHAFSCALALAPANRLAWLNLGVAFRAAERAVLATNAYRRALVLAPEWIDAEINLSNALQIQGDFTQSAGILRDLERRTGQLRFALKRALLLPIVSQNVDEIELARNQLSDVIEQLSQSSFTLVDPLHEIGQTAFYLSYHDRGDRPLQSALAQLYLRACPALSHISAFARTWRGPNNKRIRIAVVSEFLHAHTIGRLNLGLIQHLDRGRFEVVVVRPDRRTDTVRLAIDAAADHVVRLPDGLDLARRVLGDIEADIIYYTDIGMSPLTYFLAFARLAPVQMLTWGHPDTTGIPNLDQFISCAAMEPVGAEAHYTEKLRALGGPTIFYARPEPVARKSKSDFGLAEGATVYLCPQTPQKLHPDFDAAVIDILRADPKGLLVLVHGLDPFVGQRLVNRILEQASDLEERIVMLGAMSADQFRALMGVADIVLDPFHYSGGHTTLEAIDARAPLITWPGRFMRGRHTAGFLSLMGLDPMVSTSQSDYVTRALALGRDPALRQEMRAAYQTQDGAIFECAEALDPLADAFESAIVDAARRY